MVTKDGSSENVRLITRIAKTVHDRDQRLVDSWMLALGASGRKGRTKHIYQESVLQLAAFSYSKGYSTLEEMGASVIRGYLADCYERGNKHSTVSVRCRSINTFFGWLKREDERQDNPMDKIDPPRIPEELQPWYSTEEIEKVLKAVDSANHRDAAIIMTLYDTGVRASELCGMKTEDVDWKERKIRVTGKAGKERDVGLGNSAAVAIDRYLRKRTRESTWLWIGKEGKPLHVNGLRMMLERRFDNACVQFKGAHAFRRSFAMSYLEAGGQEGDLKNLGGWNSFQMVQRYAKASANERALNAHKLLSPGDRLNVR